MLFLNFPDVFSGSLSIKPVIDKCAMKPPVNRPQKLPPPVCGRTPHVHQSHREAWPCDDFLLESMKKEW